MHRWSLGVRRATLGGIAAAAMLLPSGAGAATTEVCSPTPKVPTSFCMTADLNLSSTVAGAPFDLTAEAINTSTGAMDSDQDDWLAAATFAFAPTDVPAPAITPSDQLPNNLVIAGEAGPFVLCKFEDEFAGCPAGHGTIIFNITGNQFLNGTGIGKYGIRRIVNVVDPNDPPGTAHWAASVQGCINHFQFGVQCISTVIDILIPQPATGQPLELPIATRFSATPPFGGTAESALQSIEGLHINGRSSVLADGTSAGQTFTVARLPSACGTLDGSAEFIATDATTVGIQRPLEITGCTTTLAVNASRKINVRGAVKPTVEGGAVHVTLLKKSGTFQEVDDKDIVTNLAGKFKTKFAVPDARKCRVVAEYEADATHTSSSARKTFNC